MCGRFAVSLNASQLATAAREETGNDEVQNMSSEESEQWQGDRYNVAPQTRIPVLRRDQQHGLVLSLMLWGLIPYWHKNPPETTLKTINARDDTIANGGMWSSIRGRKRAVVLCDGFYEWLKKGNDRIPHFMKRSDGHPLALACLWDSVTYEGEAEAIESVTIVTTDSNKKLSFLHDRMPVILPDPASIALWLDTSSGEWTSEVAQLMTPFEGKLECYPVAKEVGKVGNNSKDFVIPVSERKGSLNSFFARQSPKKETKKEEPISSETNAPLPTSSPSRKREHSLERDSKPEKKPKVEAAIDLDGDDNDKQAKQKTLDAFVKK